MESCSYTRQFDRLSAQADNQSEQLQTYLHEILNTTRAGKEQPVRDEAWDQGIRTMVLMHDGQVMDVNDLEEDEENDAAAGIGGIKIDQNARMDELASVKSQEERIARLIKVGDAVSERGTERSVDSRKVGDIKIKGIIDSMEDSRSQIKKLLLKRIGKGSLILFLVMVLLYLIVSIFTSGSFWIIISSYFEKIGNNIKLSSSKSQLTTSVAKSTITLGLIGMMNSGVKFGTDGSQINQDAYFAMLNSEFQYSIDQIDQASRAISDQIYSLESQQVIGDWANDGTTQMTFSGTITSNTVSVSSLVNAYQILTSQNLQLKARASSSLILTDSDIQLMQKVVQQSIMPQSWKMSEHILEVFADNLSGYKTTLYILVVVNFLVVLFPAVTILITLLRIGYRRNSVCKVYYYFSIDDVREICRKVDEYQSLMKNRETGTVLSLSFALKETSQAVDDNGDDVEENRSRGFKKTKKAPEANTQESLDTILVQKSIASKYATRLFKRTDVLFLCLGCLFTLGVAVYMTYYCMDFIQDSNYVVSLISGMYRYQQRTWTALSSFANVYFGAAKATIALAPVLLKDTEEFLTKAKSEINPFLEMPTFLDTSLSLHQTKFDQDICTMTLNVSDYTKTLCPKITPTLTQQGLLYSLLDLPFSLSQLLIYTGTFTSKTAFSCPAAGLSAPTAFGDPTVATKYGCLLNNDTTIDVFDFGMMYSHRLYRIMWEGVHSEYSSLSETSARDNLNTAIIMVLAIFFLVLAWIIVFVRDELHFRNSLLMVFHVPSNTLKKNQRLQKILSASSV